MPLKKKKKVKPKIVTIDGKKYIKVGKKKYRVVGNNKKLSNMELIKYFIDKLLKKRKVTRRVKKTSKIVPLPSNPNSASYALLHSYKKAIENEKDKNTLLEKAFDEYKKKQIEKNPNLASALTVKRKKKPKVEPDSDEEELLNFGKNQKATPAMMKQFEKNAKLFAKQKEQEKQELLKEKKDNEVKAMKAELKADLNKMRVADLKDYAKANGIKLKNGKKADLIKQIYDAKSKEIVQQEQTNVIIEELNNEEKPVRRKLTFITEEKKERTRKRPKESKDSEKAMRDLDDETILDDSQDKALKRGLREARDAMIQVKLSKLYRNIPKGTKTEKENKLRNLTMKKLYETHEKRKKIEEKLKANKKKFLEDPDYYNYYADQDPDYYDKKMTRLTKQYRQKPAVDVLDSANVLPTREDVLMQRYGTTDLNKIAEIELKNPERVTPSVGTVDRKDDSTDSRENQDGRGIKGIPLTTSDIDKIMKKYPSYLGTFARDEVKDLYKIVKPKKKAMFIFNTDTSDKEGKHWQAVFIDPVESKSVEFYDSFADPAPKSLLKDLKKIVDAMKPDTYFKFKENRIKQQSVNTANCGWFCIRFLIDRSRGKPFPEASGFSEVAKNEKNIEKFKSKFPEFNYI